MTTLKYFGVEVEISSYRCEVETEPLIRETKVPLWKRSPDGTRVIEDVILADGTKRKLPIVADTVESSTMVPYQQQYYIFETRDGCTIRITRDHKKPRRDDYPVEVRGILEFGRPEEQRATSPLECGKDSPPLAEIVFADGETEWAGVMKVLTPPRPTEMLGCQEGARYCNVTPQTVGNWLKDGLLPGVTGTGRLTLIPRASLEPYRKKKSQIKKPSRNKARKRNN